MKLRKNNLLIDITIALLFISMVIYVCYTLATSSVNKRYQASQERDALIICENIMSRVLSQGAYYTVSEPMMDSTTISKMNNIQNNSSLSSYEKNKQLLELGARLPVDIEVDAPFLPASNKYSYQVVVEPYFDSDTGVKNVSLKKVTVNVFYPTRVVKYLNEDIYGDSKNESSRDKSSLEEEYRVVTLTTYKSVREYEKQ